MHAKVELEITVTYKAQVVVSGNFEGVNDPRIDQVAQEVADNMDHGNWDYKNSEFETLNVKQLPDGLSGYHISLLQCGYPETNVLKMSDEEAEGELDAISMG